MRRRHVVHNLAQRVRDGPKGVRLTERRAGRHQRAARIAVRRREELLQQPGLADARLTLDRYDRGWSGQDIRQRRELPLTALRNPASPRR